MSARLPPDIEDLRLQFAQATLEASGLAAGLRDAQFNWRPGRERWSVADCLVHLNTVGSFYLPRIDTAMNEARARGWMRRGPARPRLLWRWVIASTEPPARIRIRALRRFRPAQPLQSVGVVLPDFMALQEGLVARLSAAHEFDLSHARTASPLTRRIHMSLAECFTFLAAHQRRQLWQARRVREEPGFPTG